MTYLRQSTAATRKLGPFVNATDGETAETGLTIQKADLRLSKNGGDMAAANANQGALDVGAPHDELGYYDIALDTTDTATIGSLRVMVSESGALPVWADFEVLHANVFDWLFGSAAPLQPTVAGRTLDVTDTGAAGIDWGNIEHQTTTNYMANTTIGMSEALGGIADDAISAASVSAAAVTKITTGIPAAVWGHATRTLSSFGTLPADIWAYAQRTLTQTAAQVAAVLAGADITATIAATLTVTLTGLSISATRTKILFTAKRRPEQADSTALLQVLVSNPADAALDGLLYINGVPASSAQRTQATLTVDAGAGTITLVVADDLMALLSRTRVPYDIKQILAAGTSSVLTAGDFATDHTPTVTV